LKILKTGCIVLSLNSGEKITMGQGPDSSLLRSGGIFIETDMRNTLLGAATGLARSKFVLCEHLCQQYSFNLVSNGW
jgi:hypothetical protein